MRGEGILAALVLIVVAVALGIPALNNADATRRATLTTERAQYEALKAQYEALKAQADAARVQAENEARLYDAAGYAVETQADLVDYYARRGDTRSALFLVVLVVVLFLIRQPAKPATDELGEL